MSEADDRDAVEEAERERDIAQANADRAQAEADQARAEADRAQAEADRADAEARQRESQSNLARVELKNKASKLENALKAGLSQLRQQVEGLDDHGLSKGGAEDPIRKGLERGGYDKK